jgi:ABC transporter substrate binding protein
VRFSLPEADSSPRSRCAVATVYEGRDFVMAGGLLSYGGSLTDSYRLAGRYAGRVLNGEKPTDLPVQQSTKVEMFLNLRTAKTLGITVRFAPVGPCRRGDRTKRTFYARRRMSGLGGRAVVQRTSLWSAPLGPDSLRLVI